MGDAIAIANIVLTLLIALVGGIWGFRNNAESVTKELEDQITESEALLENHIRDLESKMEEDIEKWTQRYGDGLTALRQKVVETELWNRDNFVNKSTFRSVVDDFKVLLAQLDSRIESGFDRLERRLERIRPESRD